MIEIRPSEPSDGEALLAIWCRAVDSSHDFLSADDRVAIEPLVAEYVGSAALTVATINGKPVGFMGVTGQNIDSLFIAPEAWRRGVGRLLTETVARPATVEVNEQNGQALAFYQHLGFRVVRRSETDGDGRPYPLLYLHAD